MDRLRQTLRSSEAELDDVEAALERLEAGTYGRCEVCGAPISEPRLEAAPATRTCADHAPPAPPPAL